VRRRQLSHITTASRGSPSTISTARVKRPQQCVNELVMTGQPAHRGGLMRLIRGVMSVSSSAAGHR
jgi:hypothetical protein